MLSTSIFGNWKCLLRHESRDSQIGTPSSPGLLSGVGAEAEVARDRRDKTTALLQKIAGLPLSFCFGRLSSIHRGSMGAAINNPYQVCDPPAYVIAGCPQCIVDYSFKDPVLLSSMFHSSLSRSILVPREMPKMRKCP